MVKLGIECSKVTKRPSASSVLLVLISAVGFLNRIHLTLASRIGYLWAKSVHATAWVDGEKAVLRAPSLGHSGNATSIALLTRTLRTFVFCGFHCPLWFRSLLSVKYHPTSASNPKIPEPQQASAINAPTTIPVNCRSNPGGKWSIKYAEAKKTGVRTTNTLRYCWADDLYLAFIIVWPFIGISQQSSRAYSKRFFQLQAYPRMYEYGVGHDHRTILFNHFIVIHWLI